MRESRQVRLHGPKRPAVQEDGACRARLVPRREARHSGEVFPGTDVAIVKLARNGNVFASCNAFAEKTYLDGWLADRLSKEVAKIAPGRRSTRDYVTRNVRLSIDRVISLEAIKWRVLVGRDGTFTDARVVVSVYDAESQLQLGTFSVWGRCRGNRNTINMERAIDDAFANLVRIEDFAKSLEVL